MCLGVKLMRICLRASVVDSIQPQPVALVSDSEYEYWEDVFETFICKKVMER